MSYAHESFYLLFHQFKYSEHYRLGGNRSTMLKIKNLHRITQLCMILVAVLFITACSSMGTAIDPGDWFYDCVVTYDALGGTINSRGIRGKPIIWPIHICSSRRGQPIC